LNNINSFPSGWSRKIIIFLVFFILGIMVFAIIPLWSHISENKLLSYHVVLSGILLITALFLRRNERRRQYWPICYVFFVAGIAVLLSTLFSDTLLSLVGLDVTTPQGVATAKVSESILRGVPILILMPIMGFGWRSLYLNKGKINIWLPVGVIAFIAFPLIAYFSLSGQERMVNKLLPLLPWILLFVISNGFIEELLFRGLFLRKYESILGKGSSNLLTALVFTFIHTQVTYIQDMLPFLFIVLILSLIWGYMIQKTNSLWGAVLFHAAADCLVLFGSFTSM
jgi:hypothetical protein